MSESGGRREPAVEAALSGAALVGNGLARLVSSVAVGRFSGPVSLGLFQASLSTSQLVALLAPTAMGNATASYVARAVGAGDLEMATATSAYLRKRSLQVAVGLSAVVATAWASVTGDGLAMSAAVAALVLGMSLYSYARGNLYGRRQVRKAVFWDLVTSTASAVAVIAALLLGASTAACVFCVALNYLSFSVATWPRSQRGVLPVASRREIDRFVFFGVVGTLASAGQLQMAVILARVLEGPAAAGQFSAAFVLATPVLLASSAISLVIYPRMSAAVGAGRESECGGIADAATRVLVAGIFPVFFLMTIYREPLIRLIWGRDYLPAADVLALLLTAMFLVTAAVPSVNAITAGSSRGARRSALSTAAAFFVGCGVWMIATPTHGIGGIAAGYMVACIFSAGVPFVLAWHQYKRAWFALAARIVGAATAMVATLLLPNELYGSTSALAVVTFGVLLVWSALCWTDLKSSLPNATRQHAPRHKR